MELNYTNRDCLAHSLVSTTYELIYKNIFRLRCAQKFVKNYIMCVNVSHSFPLFLFHVVPAPLPDLLAMPDWLCSSQCRHGPQNTNSPQQYRHRCLSFKNGPRPFSSWSPSADKFGVSLSWMTLPHSRDGTVPLGVGIEHSQGDCS